MTEASRAYEEWRAQQEQEDARIEAEQAEAAAHAYLTRIGVTPTDKINA